MTTDREIKFRYVWRRKSDGHIWLEIVPLGCLEGHGDRPFIRSSHVYWEPIARDQFTGWSVGDADVYENDVVDFAMFDGSERGLILWDKDRGKFAFKSPDGELYGINQREVERNVTVIGSVHEHPDLLTQEQD